MTPPFQQQQLQLIQQQQLLQQQRNVVNAQLPPPSLPMLPQHPAMPPKTAALPVTPVPASGSLPDEDRSKLSPLPTLKYIDDPSLFDLDALTCHACNKSFKNTRAFKLHRDRHQVSHIIVIIGFFTYDLHSIL